MAQSSASDILKEGFLTKQGGVTYHNWKQRWFVLKEESLSYYINQDDAKAKKTIKLKHGRGVRAKDCCSVKTWPGDAIFCFGLATSKRTWYFYGSEDKDVKEWSELIQQCIEKVGKPTSDWQNDPDGKPEGVASKIVRGTVKQAAKLAMDFMPSTGNEFADAAIKTGLNVVESQAGADAKTSMEDRLKMAGGDVISGVADTVDNPAVSLAANLSQNQLGNLSLNQHLAMPGGGAVRGVGNVTGIGAMNIAGGVLSNQAILQNCIATGVGSLSAVGMQNISGSPWPLAYNIPMHTVVVQNGAGRVPTHYTANH